MRIRWRIRYAWRRSLTCSAGSARGYSDAVSASELPAESGEMRSMRWLADFCSMPVLFGVMIVAELVVLVIVIAPSDESHPLLQRLATTSLFVQWLARFCARWLCEL